MAFVGPREGCETVLSSSRCGSAEPIHDRVVAACRLVDADAGVRTVHIVAPGRPTYDELRRFQDTARASRVLLSVNGHGLITVRPEQYQEGNRRGAWKSDEGVLPAKQVGNAFWCFVALWWRGRAQQAAPLQPGANPRLQNPVTTCLTKSQKPIADS